MILGRLAPRSLTAKLSLLFFAITALAFAVVIFVLLPRLETSLESQQVDDLTKVGPVIDAGLGAGANTLDGVEFGLRNDEAARAQALADAAAKARSKAETLAKALGLRLGAILEVAEGGVTISPPPYTKVGRMAMAELSAQTPVSAGQVGVEASVTRGRSGG